MNLNVESQKQGVSEDCGAGPKRKQTACRSKRTSVGLLTLGSETHRQCDRGSWAPGLGLTHTEAVHRVGPL